METPQGTKDSQYRDLTGPEKICLSKNIDIPTLFPMLPNREKLQTLWSTFLHLWKRWMKRIAMQMKLMLKQNHGCLNLFPSIRVKTLPHTWKYRYIYATRTWKLNDITTKQFQHSSNHRGISLLKQILEKRNRIETLQDQRFERVVPEQVCSRYKMPGHNKRMCQAELPLWGLFVHVIMYILHYFIYTIPCTFSPI